MSNDDMEYIAFAASLSDEFASQGKRVLGPDVLFLVRGAGHSSAGVEILYDVDPEHAVVAELLARTYRVRSRRVDLQTWTIPPLAEGWWDVLYTHFPIFRGSGLEVNAGWADLLMATAHWLEELEPGREPFVQVKEKFGWLRMYGVPHPVIDSAQRLSVFICETCGAPGKRRSDLGWIKTGCSDHA